MADIVSKNVRSEMMAKIRGKGNKSTEVRLAKLFRKYGVKGWRRHWPLVGKPDFVFQDQRIAVFVDGCFWHGCPKCYIPPSTNRKFWVEKLKSNKKRDRKVSSMLKKTGWTVVRFWECFLCDEKKAVSKLQFLPGNK